jgi:hypothetical protein
MAGRPSLTALLCVLFLLFDLLLVLLYVQIDLLSHPIFQLFCILGLLDLGRSPGRGRRGGAHHVAASETNAGQQPCEENSHNSDCSAAG